MLLACTSTLRCFAGVLADVPGGREAMDAAVLTPWEYATGGAAASGGCVELPLRPASPAHVLLESV
jgi:hypothetical protein